MKFRNLIALPFWFIAILGSLIMMCGLKIIALLYQQDSSTLFLRKLLGQDAHNWVIVTDQTNVKD